jgi:hypothetical protein
LPGDYIFDIIMLSGIWPGLPYEVVRENNAKEDSSKGSQREN